MTHLWSLVRPGLETSVVDTLVTVLAHQQVLALVRHTRRLIAHDAGLAVVAGPALRLEVSHQLVRVDPAAGVDALATVVTGDQGLCLSRWVGGLCTQTLRTYGHLLRLLQLR